MHKKKNIDKQKEIEEFFRDDEEEIKVKEIKKIVAERKSNKNNSKEEEKQKKENIEKMLLTISTNKKIPKDILRNIYSNVFQNLAIAIIVMAYLFFIILGCFNIEKIVYEKDIKVFTGILFIITIFLIETAYKKKNTKLTIHSIECLVLAICNLFFIYFYTIFFEKYHLIVGLISISFGIYYVIKSIIIFIMRRRKYFNTMSDIIEILSSDYDEEDFKCQEV